MLEIFKKFKLGKWISLTIIPNYYPLGDEVFMKPTTVKGIIKYFDLKGVVYNPQPNWNFY